MQDLFTQQPLGTWAVAYSLVGASVHDVAGANRRAGADYLLVGPIWDTPGKPACGLGVLSAVVGAASVPVFAVGCERATQWALAPGPKLMALTCNRYRRDRARPVRLSGGVVFHSVHHPD